MMWMYCSTLKNMQLEIEPKLPKDISEMLIVHISTSEQVLEESILFTRLKSTCQEWQDWQSD